MLCWECSGRLTSVVGSSLSDGLLVPQDLGLVEACQFTEIGPKSVKMVDDCRSQTTCLQRKRVIVHE